MQQKLHADSQCAALYSMSVNPGGKQRAMRDTTWLGAPQRMVFAPGDTVLVPNQTINVYQREDGSIEQKKKTCAIKQGEVITDGHDLVGQAKGLRQVLLERGIDIKGMKGKCVAKKGAPLEEDGTAKRVHAGDSCCMVASLLACEDFKQTQCRLRELINGAGHTLLFLPKFHCELAPVSVLHLCAS